jgi:hypothetical protein
MSQGVRGGDAGRGKELPCVPRSLDPFAAVKPNKVRLTTRGWLAESRQRMISMNIDTLLQHKPLYSCKPPLEPPTSRLAGWLTPLRVSRQLRE